MTALLLTYLWAGLTTAAGLWIFNDALRQINVAWPMAKLPKARRLDRWAFGFLVLFWWIVLPMWAAAVVSGRK